MQFLDVPSFVSRFNFTTRNCDPQGCTILERRKGGIIGQVRREIRLRQYSSRTEKAYVWWIRQFVRFNDFRHPSEMGQAEATEFLMVRAKRRTRLPVVLAPEEVKAVLRQMKGTPRLIAALL